MNTYKIEKLPNFININFRGKDWKFKSLGFNTEGMTNTEISNRIKIEIENNKE